MNFPLKNRETFVLTENLSSSAARLPIGRGVRARRYKLTATSMTTGPQSATTTSQTEINNNSNSLNAENNNNNVSDEDDYDDEENTSEYGTSMGTEQLRNAHDFSNMSSSETAKELSNRLNNNNNNSESCCSKTNATGLDVLASSTDSDNILNNNNVYEEGDQLQEEVSGDDNVVRVVNNQGAADQTGTGVQKDSNHNQVVVVVVPQPLNVN